jgi:hypothetical protein
MTDCIKFGAIVFALQPGWQDITDDLPAGTVPTLARADGVGVLQFSRAVYEGGVVPNIGPRELGEMLEAFGRGQELEAPTNVRTVATGLTTLSGDFANESEFIRVWYATDGRNVSFITYTSQQPANPATGEELNQAELMVRSIRP